MTAVAKPVAAKPVVATQGQGYLPIIVSKITQLGIRSRCVNKKCNYKLLPHVPDIVHDKLSLNK